MDLDKTEQYIVRHSMEEKDLDWIKEDVLTDGDIYAQKECKIIDVSEMLHHSYLLAQVKEHIKKIPGAHRFVRFCRTFLHRKK